MKTLLITALCLVGAHSIFAQPGWAPATTFQDSVYRDFDFWIGEWDVALRVKQPDQSWAVMKQAKAVITPVLQGKAILELWNEKTTELEGTRGFSLRYYNPQTGLWDLFLNWPRPGYSRTALFTGIKDHDRFDFSVRYPINDSIFQIARYTFSDITPHSLRWHDSYSRDEGRTWAHNWIMNFRRTKKLPSPWQPEDMPTYLNGERCTAPEFERLEAWYGINQLRWSGQDWAAEVYPILDGCGLLLLARRLVGVEVVEKLLFVTYNTVQQQYDLIVLDTDERPAVWYRGVMEGESLLLTTTEDEGSYILLVEEGRLVFQRK